MCQNLSDLLSELECIKKTIDLKQFMNIIAADHASMNS